MKPDVYKVLVTQFLTAFADNAVLFAAITMVMQQSTGTSWYVPALQASFLVAFVVLAPWVGPFADGRSKKDVLWQANLIKAGGAFALLVGLGPMLAYAVIGIGAALYSPAKYGILPELVDESQLVKANGYIEGSTIVAILGGTLVGAFVANQSIQLAFALVIGLYIVSALAALMVSRLPARSVEKKAAALHHFMFMCRGLLATPRARFATLGVSLFWAAATVLRVLLVAWAPVVLMISNSTEIAALTLFVAIGIAVGALIAPRVIPMAYLRRARMAAYAMAAVIVLLSTITTLDLARVALFLCGLAGGMFVVPINAALQEIGHKSIGSGSAVAVQNFFENISMLVATGLYTLAAQQGADPVMTMAVLGVIILIATVLVSWHLPPDTGSIDQDLPEAKDE